MGSGGIWATVHEIAKNRTQPSNWAHTYTVIKNRMISEISPNIWKLLLLLFSHSVVFDYLWLYGLQRARLPCPPSSPRVCSNPHPLKLRCYLTISSFSTLLSFCPKSFPALGSFPLSQFFTSDIGAKVLKLQLQHQSFQRIFRVDFL